MNISFNAARRLVETEAAYIEERAMLDTYEELDIEQFQILATLDTKTSEICRMLDGKIFDKKDAKSGVTVPPFHCYCRSTTVPYLGEIAEETRAARDPATGKSDRVENMTYEEWRAKYVKSESEYLKAEQGKVRRPSKKELANMSEALLVDFSAVNSAAYREKFDDMPMRRPMRDALHKEAIHTLNVTNGTEKEVLTALDARTGEVLARSKELQDARVGFTREQFERLKSRNTNIILLHNHPEGGRFSWADIRTAFAYEFIEASVVVGHDGSVRVMREINHTVDIEKAYQTLYNDIKNEIPVKSLAEMKTLDEIYRMKVFTYDEE